jgi:hypothetical protein
MVPEVRRKPQMRVSGVLGSVRDWPEVEFRHRRSHQYAYAERFVLSIKSECLDRIVPPRFGRAADRP